MPKHDLIFITAPWCATCKSAKPITEKKCADKGITVRILDMVHDEELCAKYNPTALPTLIYGPLRIDGNFSVDRLEAILK